MTLRLVRSAYVLESARKHVDSLKTQEPEVESILSAHACSVIYSETEKAVRAIITERLCEATDDQYVHAYAKVATERIVRSVKIGELAGYAGHFDTSCKTRFHDHLTPTAKASWDTIMGSRHSVAHETGTTFSLTLRDTELYFTSVTQVLEAFRACLTNDAGCSHCTDEAQ